MSPIETVRHIYAAFGRGDVPAILACLADDVAWEYGQPPHPAPWLQQRRGRAAVPGFFDALLSNVEFHRFEPKRQLADGLLVVGLVDFEATVRKTGRKVIEVDEVHLFHFNEAGQVLRFAHRADTLQHASAWLGS
ncbi:MAG: nuclear transport factor 2 family protein [Rubrivivax sp.]|nr:nuclear transport factor 2 family protein [Rubrivivax sp.]